MKSLIGLVGTAAVLAMGTAHAQEGYEDTAPEASYEEVAPVEEAAPAEGYGAELTPADAAPVEEAPSEDVSAEAAPTEEVPAEMTEAVETVETTEETIAEVPADGLAPDSFAADTGSSDTYSDSTVTEEVATEETSESSGRSQKYLGILGTGTDPDKDRSNSGADIDYGAGFSLLYGWQSANNWGVEVQGFSETFETSDTLRTDFYRYGANIDLFYAFGDRTSFTPFILIGAGGNYNDVFPREDDLTWFANAGIGFVTGPFIKTGNLRLRGEARYIYDDFEDGYGDIRYALGIEIPLFADEEIEVAAVTEEVKVVEVSTGLKDSDGDGIVDDKDQCPDTPAGERVDGNGCPLGKIIALKGVTFEFDKTRLRPDAQTILDWATDILKKYPDMQVEVAGHTDSLGSDAYNQKLSEGRASAVRDYFVEKGVTNTLTVKGYGEAEPVADNDSDEGRERNRRVELRILN